VPSREEWVAARAAYEAAEATQAELAASLGVSRQAVNARAAREAWRTPTERAPVPTPNPVPGAPATVAAQLDSWHDRAPGEAAAAGIGAAIVRRRILELVRDPAPPEASRQRQAEAATIRALAEAYKAFIATAQMLAGEPETATILTPEERAARLRTLVHQIAERSGRDVAAPAPASSAVIDVEPR
jgi:hypothetical protein